MKNLNRICSLAFIAILVLTGCSKDEERAIDCSIELLKADITSDIDATDGKKVTFTLKYNGEYTLSNTVNWDFGDGQTETGGTTITHTYANTGTHIAKGNFEIRRGSSKCSTQAKETVHL